ncbi:MAG: glycosyltransferase family 2 protein [Chloroflexota bacterium]|nr:glycosyltransferase family 2 protein [Chloroflexota bacterium]
MRSIFAQTYQPGLLLVIDDGSSDDSPAIADRVLAACPFPSELVVRGRRGLSATLNEGLDRISGDILAYVGSDDLWHPERLHYGVETLQAHPQAVAAFGPCYLIDESDLILNIGTFATMEGHRRPPWAKRVRAPSVSLRTLLSFRTVPLSPSVTYRQAAVERFRWNEASPMEDYEMYLLLASVGEYAYVEQPLGAWRLHALGTSRKLESMLDEALATQRRIAQRLGLSPGDLAACEAGVRYAYGEQFLRSGQWRKGVALTVANVHGAPHSATALAERVARIAATAVTASARRGSHGSWPAQRTAPRTALAWGRFPMNVKDKPEVARGMDQAETGRESTGEPGN